MMRASRVKTIRIFRQLLGCGKRAEREERNDGDLEGWGGDLAGGDWGGCEEGKNLIR